MVVNTMDVVLENMATKENLNIVSRYHETSRGVETLRGWVLEETQTKVGTKYEVFQEVCPKCGGTGKLPEYSHVDDGVCFKCLGSGKGKVRKRLKVLDAEKIQEIENKLESTKEAKEKAFKSRAYKDSLKDRKRWFKFYDSDELVIAQGNTYNCKDELKAQGFVWQNWLRSWVSNKPDNKPALKGISYKTITIWDICYVNEYNVVVDWMDAIHEIAGYR